ncbi:Fe-S cluster assembly protein HesB [Arthrobacter psychrolactophilus]|uniref:Adenine DNA glycosylase n=1 Tax=Arthrobacter psychrolactophilus TaxID=92442 RepID=A0A2V5JNT6_9MICC|nr:A/G-specific adenine glycosylase [Arthrobacter psychrolactophilus]PYI40076.1 Fe-S cluster assembly protein HesB [Arthrobacter psychrolactophilus]
MPLPASPAVPPSVLHATINDWFRDEARDLPWRGECSAWGILVSEIMLQQTPVVRVRPIWEQWLERWPTPADFAAAPAADVLRAWGKLGYPRRALRLHAAAAQIVAEHHGAVPDNYEQLLSLPGVGSYTAAAVAAFAYGRRTTVVDTNIRRVHARLVIGQALPAPALTAAEMSLAADLLPEATEESVLWNASVMELGALICTARSPKCGQCPVFEQCAWIAAGQPEPSYIPKGQPWAGTDRQVRGAVMAVLRAAGAPVHADLMWDAEAASRHDEVATELGKLHALNTHAPQLERALAGLVADGLAQVSEAGYQLPR